MTEQHPLTHHEILRLIEPFTRRGRHVDLSATDRIERRIVFKPVVHGGEMPACAGACEILVRCASGWENQPFPNNRLTSVIARAIAWSMS